MSRRVFDVGLDMNRMRHSLRPHRRNKSTKQATEKERPVNLITDGIPNAEEANTDREARDGLDRGNTQPRQRLDNSQPGGKSFSPLKSHPHAGVSSANDDQKSPVPEQNLALQRHSDEDSQDYDLKPPPPNKKVKHIDHLSERLFSHDHLEVILKDPTFLLRFTAFLSRYKPQLNLLLMHYLEAQKVYRAIAYANALSETTKISPEGKENFGHAASINPEFDDKSKKAFDALVSEALPAYVNHSLSKVVTEYMVREITGTALPIMRELVGGLAEVFCLADPKEPDCPIVYASEEFYRTTRYSRDDVIGRNCRFLQGPKTKRASIDRLSSSIKAREECCEIVLNYRRDGSPFMNLLLISPLFDNRGSVKYYIGAQVDVSGLVEDGRGLESFERLLHGTNSESDAAVDADQRHLQALNELGQLLSVDETNALTQNPTESPNNSKSNNDNTFSLNSSMRSSPHPRHRQQWSSSTQQSRRHRVVLGADDDDDNEEQKPFNSPPQPSRHQSAANKAWTLSSSVPSSGRLPGVYQNYFLVRPHPNMRIIFASPSLRIPGLLQSPLLSHILGPESVKRGINDAFQAGAAVTAKVIWTAETEDGGAGGNVEGKARYISCTPLLGSDDEVGVWMVVMVEKESSANGSLRRNERFNGNGQGWGQLRNGGADGAGGGEDDYASYMRNSASVQGTPTPSRGKDTAGTSDGTGPTTQRAEANVNGIDSERRFEEVFTPAEEKPNMM